MITARVQKYIRFEGDQESELIFNSGLLDDSPKAQQLVTLAIGANTITVPLIVGLVVHGVVIVPPDANTIEPTLKGVAGDTGILLSASQASVIHFGATVPVSIVLQVAADIVGLRLVWF